MLSKTSKLMILENFYSIDYILLGKPVREASESVCCPFFLEEYLQLKGALLSTLTEIYDAIEYEPTMNVKDKTTLIKESKVAAKNAKNSAAKLLLTSEGKKYVQNALNESIACDNKINPEILANDVVRKKAMSLALDSLLIGRTVTESYNFDELNSWNGKIFEEAYKNLRDRIVESAIFILDEISEEI